MHCCLLCGNSRTDVIFSLLTEQPDDVKWFIQGKSPAELPLGRATTISWLLSHINVHTHMYNIHTYLSTLWQTLTQSCAYNFTYAKETQSIGSIVKWNFELIWFSISKVIPSTLYFLYAGIFPASTSWDAWRYLLMIRESPSCLSRHLLTGKWQSLDPMYQYSQSRTNLFKALPEMPGLMYLWCYALRQERAREQVWVWGLLSQEYPCTRVLYRHHPCTNLLGECCV